jgi:hypothetical protein
MKKIAFCLRCFMGGRRRCVPPGRGSRGDFFKMLSLFSGICSFRLIKTAKKLPLEHWPDSRGKRGMDEKSLTLSYRIHSSSVARQPDVRNKYFLSMPFISTIFLRLAVPRLTKISTHDVRAPMLYGVIIWDPGLSFVNKRK